MTGLNAVVNKRIRARPKESRPSPEAQCGLLPCPPTTLPPASHRQGGAQNQRKQAEQTQRDCLSTSERQRRRGLCRRNGGCLIDPEHSWRADSGRAAKNPSANVAVVTDDDEQGEADPPQSPRGDRFRQRRE